MSKGLAGIALAALIFSAGSARAQAAVPVDAAAAAAPVAASHDARSTVAYATVNGQKLLADMYLLKGAGPFPAIVFIHGGAWKSGDRSQLHGQAELMAAHGFVGMAIEYRLAPANKYPAALDDARTAVRWLRQHAKEYNIDGDRIAAVGSSAGAHLSAMLGVESTPLAAGQHRAADDASVEAVVAFNGIYDLATMPLSDKTEEFLGGSCAALPKVCAEASPQQHVRPGLPPFLLLHGTADETAPYAQALAFQKALKDAKDKVELFTAPGAPHTFWGKPQWKEPSFNAMREFLTKTL